MYKAKNIPARFKGNNVCVFWEHKIPFKKIKEGKILFWIRNKTILVN